MTREWNPDLYQSSHSFVWEYGRDLLGLLEPEPGLRILDAGCGTGQLTAEIARAGSETVGIDSSAAMIGQARDQFPGLDFRVQDVCSLPFHEEFDAVFSNAALHWVLRAGEAAGAIARALKPGGRFVAELGGHGNVRLVMESVRLALQSKKGARSRARETMVLPWHWRIRGHIGTAFARSHIRHSL